MVKKTNIIQFGWIAFRSVMWTLGVSCYALWLAFRRKNTRASIDRLARIWSQRLLDYIDLRYTLVGEMPLIEPGRRYIIMCSHASHYDIPLSFVALDGSIRMLAKNELSSIPVFGRAMASSEFIFIDRRHREKAMKDLQAARKKMEDGIVLWVSPEGTRSPDGQLLPFKKGCFYLALDTQALIIPIGIRGIGDVLPNKKLDLYTGVECEVHIGNVINAGSYSGETREKLMRDVEYELRRLLNQPKAMKK